MFVTNVNTNQGISRTQNKVIDFFLVLHYISTYIGVIFIIVNIVNIIQQAREIERESGKSKLRKWMELTIAKLSPSPSLTGLS